MRICVVGAGSIGGYLAVRLIRAGCDVSVIARGAHLAAIAKHGLRLRSAAGDETVHPALATDTMAEVGPQDVVLLGMKAHQVEPIVAGLSALLHDETVVVPLQNGIPWWYFQRGGGVHEGRIVRAVDPRGAIASGIDPRRIIGCVVYPAGEVAAPGVIRHVEGNRLPLGELDGSTTTRIARLSAVLEDAGIKAPVLPDIRAEIWLKLWGNLTFNPISALTRATLEDICTDPLTRGLAVGMMTEAQAIAGKLGIEFRVPLERRIAGAAKVGRHKTSMLQDIEAGRATEIDALLGAVIELARLTETPVPHLDAMYACTCLLQRSVCGPAQPVALPANVAAAA